MNIAPKPPAAMIPTYKPDRVDEKYIRDGLAFLTMVAPFWSHILYSQMTIAYTEHVPYAGTDAHVIFVNPKAMKEEKWGLEEVAFVLAHEVCHYMFGDLISSCTWRDSGQVVVSQGKVLPYVHKIMNWAMDYRINAALIAGKVGKRPSITLYDKTLSEKGMEGAVEIYEKLFEQSDGGEGGLDGPGNFDVHIDPGAQARRDEHGNAPAKRAQAVAAALQAAEAAGKGNLPECIKRMIGELIDPKVKWQDHLRSSMLRAAGEPAHDWSKVNKRMISRPDHKIVFARRGNFGCGTVVVGIDTSGSINEAMINRFFAETAGIVADLNPAELIVIWCDAKVHRVDHLDDPTDLDELHADVNTNGAGGGGGTSFQPVFKHVHEHHIEPDMLVYLTDTYGSFPSEQPSYPVIWGSIVPNPKVPWGHVVEVEL